MSFEATQRGKQFSGEPFNDHAGLFPWGFDHPPAVPSDSPQVPPSDDTQTNSPQVTVPSSDSRELSLPGMFDGNTPTQKTNSDSIRGKVEKREDAAAISPWYIQSGLFVMDGVLLVLRKLSHYIGPILRELLDSVGPTVRELFGFFGRVCKFVLWMMTIPCVVSFCVCILYVGVAIHVRRFTEVLRSPIVHMCNMPIVSSYWRMWPCGSDITSLHPVLPDFNGLGRTEDTLQTIVDESLDIMDSGWKLWRSEAAVVDLIKYVANSDLECKDVLLPLLKKLVGEIDATAEALRVLSSIIQAAANRVLSVNAYVLNSLESLTPHWFELLFPTFSARLCEKFHADFEWTIDILLTTTSEILIHCKITLGALDSMKSTLAEIHDVVSRERIVAMNERDMLRMSFWTKLGGNQSRLRDIAKHLDRLRSVAKYRTAAIKHVLKTSEGVAQLRENISVIRNDAASAARPATRLTSLYMKSQLSTMSHAMAGISESMTNVRKRNAGVGREAAEAAGEEEVVGPSAGYVSL